MSERIDLDELDKLCRAATPGPWRFGDWSATFGTIEDSHNMRTLERNLTQSGPEPYVCGRQDGRYEVLRLEEPVERPANAAFITSVDPDTVGGLLDRIRELEAALRIAERYVCTTEDDQVVNGVLEKGTVRRG